MSRTKEAKTPRQPSSLGKSAESSAGAARETVRREIVTIIVIVFWLRLHFRVPDFAFPLK